MINERNQSILDKTKDTDEPVMIFRAQDVLSVELIIQYRRLCIWHGGVTDEFIQVVEDQIRRFKEWQDKNPDRVKTPDL